MPKYEVGYILSSLVSDDEAPKVIAEITAELQKLGASVIKEDHWGRKKLAYPIGRTRNGYYVFTTVNIEASKVKELEHKLRTTDSVIRFIIVNMEEAERRMVKDEEARLKRSAASKRFEERGSGDQPSEEVEEKKAVEEDKLSEEESADGEPVDLEDEIEKATSGEEKI